MKDEDLLFITFSEPLHLSNIYIIYFTFSVGVVITFYTTVTT